MDKITHYRTIIKRIMTEYNALAAYPPTPGVDVALVFDETHDQYLWLQTGWTQQGRARGITLYLRIVNGKIWIEEDWTGQGITNDLVTAGIPKEDIVLAFQPPEMRPYTEFAVA